jgi:hypothetical protein
MTIQTLGPSPKLPVRFMGKHPVFGKTKRTRAVDGSIRNTESGIRYLESPYYWWWRALKLSDRYKDVCIKNGNVVDKDMRRLYRDFGNIFAQEFEPWWRANGALLFGEPPSPISVKQVNLERIEDYRETVESEQTLIIAIPLFLTKKQIATAVRKLVAKNHQGKRGRTSIKTRKQLTKAKYPLQHYKGIASISNALEIVEKRKGGASLKSLLQRNRIDISVVSRSERMGKTLIRQVERGKFPITRV